MRKSNRTVILGTGKVAKALYRALKEITDVTIISSRGDFSTIQAAQLYIIAVKDDVITEVSERLSQHIGDAIVCHTSGTKSIYNLSNKIANRAVLYPLQSFTDNVTIDFCSIPILIEAETEQVKDFMFNFVELLSRHVYEVDSSTREHIHLSAVFVNNFTNHIFTLAGDIISKNNLPKELLHPLITSTFERLKEISPMEAQTGPARRGDTKTINRHKEILRDNPDMLSVYTSITESIIKKHIK